MNPARTVEINADLPEKLLFLFEPHRYKVAYGGRGGAKSWNFARALLLLGAKRPLRILCARELQKSIADSVHKLLCDQIELLGLQEFYRVEKARIYALNGTEFFFFGLKHNPDAIKSAEGVDIVWVEEAQAVSDESFRTLIPTVRKDNSEIWLSFNPELEHDSVYRRFVSGEAPPGSMVVKINFRDNPWFPDALKLEMEHLRATDPDEYNHVWEGCCINILKNAIYANELRAVDRDSRIRSVPYDPARPVDCFWDLGYGDMTAIWFAQAFPFEYRLIDYIEESGRNIQWYLQQMQSRGYVYGTDWLPWDLGLHAAAMGSGKSIEELMRLAGRKVRILPKLPVVDGINAARTIFPLCWFDAERCAEGLRALRLYRYGELKTVDHVTREPLHDASSHGADAFRYFAVGVKAPKLQNAPAPAKRPMKPVSAWA